MKSKELFPGIFSRYAESYQRRLEDVMDRGEARSRQRVLELIAPRPGMRVLDLACGPATLSARIAKRVRPDGLAVGIDLAPGMIERARRAEIPRASFAVMDMERLAFRDESFDAATCGHGLQFVPDLGRVLSETRRVLKPGSVFAASIPVSHLQDPVWVALDGVIAHWLAPAQEAVDREETKRTVADGHSLKAAAQRAGFSTALVEVVEERARWESAEQLVSLSSGWWDCAPRLERTESERRDAFLKEAVNVLRHNYPGPIETTGRSHVLSARA